MTASELVVTLGVWRLDAGAERAVASVHDNVIVGDSRDTGELTAASCVQCTVLYSVYSAANPAKVTAQACSEEPGLHQHRSCRQKLCHHSPAQPGIRTEDRT